MIGLARDMKILAQSTRHDESAGWLGRWPEAGLSSLHPAISIAADAKDLNEVGRLRYELYIARDGKAYRNVDHIRTRATASCSSITPGSPVTPTNSWMPPEKRHLKTSSKRQSIHVEHVRITSARPYEDVLSALKANAPPLDPGLAEDLRAARTEAIASRRAHGQKIWLFESRDHGSVIQAEGRAEKAVQFEKAIL